MNRFDVDLGAIAHNVAAVRKSIGRGVWLCAALKADAYGFGLVPVAAAAVGAGADALAVGSIADGIMLRRTGVSAPILVYGGEPMTRSAVNDLEGNGLIATIHDAAALRDPSPHDASHAVSVPLASRRHLVALVSGTLRLVKSAPGDPRPDLAGCASARAPRSPGIDGRPPGRLRE